jgi:ATP-dependent Clp protease ATP-binding subunit ClpB
MTLKWLADEGYDPVFGARPLKRSNNAPYKINGRDDPCRRHDGGLINVSAGVDGCWWVTACRPAKRQPPEDAVVH